ncbi:4'-phosphopantetheinyl transferase family protein [Dactylosporangium sp. CA-092794]|uniref:4'-phosphopantetheinyl transferase family protein n=1 Tax=Dactylosporangium sp. CA-092794 TaxID=3239929 RepID=UPI003D8AF0D1
MTTVDIWLVDCRAPFAERLDAAESARRDALRDPDDRRRFAAAHSALHRIVTRRLGVTEVAWRYGPNGKPFVAGGGLQCNLSHSGEYALVAVTVHRPVGIDLQDVVPGLDHAAMAGRYFPPVEADLVQRLGPAEFVSLWARKEAVVKAAGGRLIRGLSVPVAGDPPPPVDYDGVRYTVADLPAPPGFRASVALAGPEPFVIRTN